MMLPRPLGRGVWDIKCFHKKNPEKFYFIILKIFQDFLRNYDSNL